MRRDQIAEWLLSLVGDPGRSASTVGDLMELGGGQRPVWFWSHVAGTMFFQLGRALRAKPFRLALLLLGGLVLSSLWSVAIMAAAIIVPAALAGGNGFRGAQFDAAAVVTMYAVPWIVGRWIALCAPGREMAAALLMTVTFLAIPVGLQPVLSWQLHPISLGLWVMGKIFFPMALMASATIVRRQSLRTGA